MICFLWFDYYGKDGFLMIVIRYLKVKFGLLEREILIEIGGNKNIYRFLLNVMIGW